MCGSKFYESDFNRVIRVTDSKKLNQTKYVVSLMRNSTSVHTERELKKNQHFIHILKVIKKIYRSFGDGLLIRSMDLVGQYITIVVYMDAFGTNNPIGSSSDKHKIMGE